MFTTWNRKIYSSVELSDEKGCTFRLQRSFIYFLPPTRFIFVFFSALALFFFFNFNVCTYFLFCFHSCSAFAVPLIPLLWNFSHFLWISCFPIEQFWIWTTHVDMGVFTRAFSLSYAIGTHVYLEPTEVCVLFWLQCVHSTIWCAIRVWFSKSPVCIPHLVRYSCIMHATTAGDADGDSRHFVRKIYRLEEKLLNEVSSSFQSNTSMFLVWSKWYAHSSGIRISNEKTTNHCRNETCNAINW